MTGAVFSPVTNPHALVHAVAVVCAFVLWAGVVAAVVLLSRREKEERARDVS